MSTIARKRIAALPNLPWEGSLQAVPELAADTYARRLAALRDRFGDHSHLVFYADREHFSNVEYFTGFDPRFEEALLIVPREGEVTLVVGNEGDDYANKIPFPFKKVIYPTFSLPGQPRESSLTLEEIFRASGIREGDRVGLAGWKLFGPKDPVRAEDALDAPYFIVRALERAVARGRISGANEIMIGNERGLRHSLEAEDMALCEIAGTMTSRSVYAVLRALKEGMSEEEASRELRISGMPLSAHPNVNFADNAFYGLASPTMASALRRGDVVGAGMAYRRSLCHKVSNYILDAREETEERRTFFDDYFRAVAAWYEALEIGAPGKEVYRAVRGEIGDLRAFGIGLNPGHLIHTEEWSNSPFAEDCDAPLRSGMAIQCDFTASRPARGLTVHAEDGVLLADAALRDALKRVAPEGYARIEARRLFMKAELGIELAPEVLPTSDMPAVVFPYLMDLGIVLSRE
ncbi:MAG: M24 family metallopeptidase [Clostridiales bacterium]|jgi:Xaa-Pro aminopeptidase|nr:M24 family metallopeptidase [Clostridiales bacterium]